MEKAEVQEHRERLWEIVRQELEMAATSIAAARVMTRVGSESGALEAIDHAAAALSASRRRVGAMVATRAIEGQLSILDDE